MSRSWETMYHYHIEQIKQLERDVESQRKQYSKIARKARLLHEKEEAKIDEQATKIAQLEATIAEQAAKIAQQQTTISLQKNQTTYLWTVIDRLEEPIRKRRATARKRRATAATKIQALWRGYAARRGPQDTFWCDGEGIVICYEHVLTRSGKQYCCGDYCTFARTYAIVKEEEAIHQAHLKEIRDYSKLNSATVSTHRKPDANGNCVSRHNMFYIRDSQDDASFWSTCQKCGKEICDYDDPRLDGNSSVDFCQCMCEGCQTGAPSQKYHTCLY